MVLSFGEMLEADAPAHEIWLDDEALNAHFQALKEKRKDGSGGGGDDTEEWEENAAALAFLKSIGS